MTPNPSSATIAASGSFAIVVVDQNDEVAQNQGDDRSRPSRRSGGRVHVPPDSLSDLSFRGCRPTRGRTLVDDELEGVDQVVSDDNHQQAPGDDVDGREHESEKAGDDDADRALHAVAERERDRGADREQPRRETEAGSGDAD